MFDVLKLNEFVLDFLMALTGIISFILIIKILLNRKETEDLLKKIIYNRISKNMKIQIRGLNEKRPLYRNKSFLRMKNDGDDPCKYSFEIKINTSLFYNDDINMYY